MTPNKDFSDFLLAEYQNIAAAFFNSREVLAKWVKYYLIVMAAPFSFIAFIYKERPDQFIIFSLPSTLSILIGLIGFVGVFLSFIIIESGIDSVLYARTVNGVRKYFVDGSGATDFAKYIVLPIDTKKPSYLGFGTLAWITLITGTINSFYLSISVPQIVTLTVVPLCFLSRTQASVLLFVFLVLGHLAYYHIASFKKHTKYGKHA